MRTWINRIAALVLIGAVGVSAGGCAQTKQFISNVGAAVSSIGKAKVPAKTILVAATTFNGLEKVATQYLSLKICGSMPCRDPQLTEPIARYVYDGRIARDAAVEFLAAHPGELGDAGIYDALVTANTALQKIFADNRIK